MVASGIALEILRPALHRTLLAYWWITIPFEIFMFMAGFSELITSSVAVEGMTRLGYPLYFTMILGTMKLLGATAILLTSNLIVMEWVYAGFSFDLLGAMVSHLWMGDPVNEWSRPLLVYLYMLLSYGLWRRRVIYGRMGI